MTSTIHSILKPFASLRLTVVLLVMAIVVVFAGTWAQIDEGIWQVQRKYFHSFFCIIDFNLFLPRSTPDLSGFSRPIAAITSGLISFLSHISIPMLGGYSLIILLLLNLLAAHTVRFKLNRKRIGIILIHAGLILLITGEIVTSLFAVEQRMTIWQGASSNFASDIRYAELAIIDPSPSDHNNVAVIPGPMLASGALITDPKLPFPVTIDRLYRNSMVLGPAQAQQANLSSELQPTAGSMTTLTLIPIPQESGTAADKYDVPGAFVTITDSTNKPQTLLLSCEPDFDNPQDVTFNGKHYQIALRFKRYYKPFTMHLAKFTHEMYTGSDTPKNFASQIQLTDPTSNVDREVKIWMNHPLRYAGETFYQADFDHLHDRYTVLQVVHNPAWFIPYLACSMVALGMLIHFGTLLINFLQKRNQLRAPLRRRV